MCWFCTSHWSLFLNTKLWINMLKSYWGCFLCCSYPNVTLSRLELYAADPYDRAREVLKVRLHFILKSFLSGHSPWAWARFWILFSFFCTILYLIAMSDTIGPPNDQLLSTNFKQLMPFRQRSESCDNIYRYIYIYFKSRPFLCVCLHDTEGSSHPPV